MWVIQAGILSSEPVRVPHPINSHQYYWGASQVPLVVKNPLANARDLRTRVRFLGQEDPLEEGMATHSSILAWRIPWTEEPGGL